MDRRLGRGLGALLSDPTEQQQAQEAPAASPTEVALAEVRPNQYQPRLHFDPEGLEELRDSIQAHGVLQPIVVCKREEGYELIAGERRMRAAKMAGLERVPAVIREDLSDQDMLELALVENVQRRDLDPIERAKGYQRLIEECDLTQEQVSIKVGKSRSQVANFLRLLKLPPRVQAGLRDGTLSVGHARALINVDDPDVQLTLAKAVSDDDLSVRDVEHRVRAWREAQAAVEAEQEAIDDAPAPTVSTPDINTLQIQQFMDLLRKRYSTQVSIKPNNTGGGRIELAYYSQDDLERLIELLVP